MNSVYHTELSSHEGTRCQFNGGTGVIKLGIDVHQNFYVVVAQERSRAIHRQREQFQKIVAQIFTTLLGVIFPRID